MCTGLNSDNAMAAPPAAAARPASRSPDPGSDTALPLESPDLAALLELFPDATIAGDRAGKIVLANQLACALLGYAPEELLGRSIDILKPEGAESIHACLQHRLEEVSFGSYPSGRNLALTFLLKNGTVLPANVTLGPIPSSMGPMVALAIRDATSGTSIENSLRTLERMFEARIEERTRIIEEARALAEKANREKSTILATVSHEIRTPMHAILGTLELVAQSGLSREQRQCIALAHQSAESLIQLVNDLLDASKTEAGVLRIRPRATSIARVAEDLVALFRTIARSKGLEIDLLADDSIQSSHLVDRARLQQVLSNLVSNAIKFTDHGKITVSISLLENLAGAQIIEFSVEDTGRGFTDEEGKLLFSPYVQLSAARPGEPQGTGLGLSISRSLVQAMGGSITVNSVPRQGTRLTFALRLPTADSPGKERPIQAPEATPYAFNHAEPKPVETAASILVVDDHPINLDVIRRQIERIGYSVTTASCGKEALEKWRSGNYRLVLTDCSMPDMDGYALAREIRRFEAQRGIDKPVPIIACSADARVSEFNSAAHESMTSCLIKPVGLDRLRSCLAQWLAAA